MDDDIASISLLVGICSIFLATRRRGTFFMVLAGIATASGSMAPRASALMNGRGKAQAKKGTGKRKGNGHGGNGGGGNGGGG